MTQAQTRTQMHRHFTQSHVRTYRQVQFTSAFCTTGHGRSKPKGYLWLVRKRYCHSYSPKKWI